MDLKRKFPLFDLKLHNEYVILCGGGGDAMYGKINGIILCDLKMNSLYFLQLDDLVENIEIVNWEIDVCAWLKEKKRTKIEKKKSSGENRDVTKKIEKDETSSSIEVLKSDSKSSSSIEVLKSDSKSSSSIEVLKKDSKSSSSIEVIPEDSKSSSTRKVANQGLKTSSGNKVKPKELKTSSSIEAAAGQAFSVPNSIEVIQNSSKSKKQLKNAKSSTKTESNEAKKSSNKTSNKSTKSSKDTKTKNSTSRSSKTKDTSTSEAKSVKSENAQDLTDLDTQSVSNKGVNTETTEKSKKIGIAEKNTFYFIAIGIQNYYIIQCSNNELQIIFQKEKSLENAVFYQEKLHHTENDVLIRCDIDLENKQVVPLRTKLFINDSTVIFNHKNYNIDEEICNLKHNEITDELIVSCKQNNKTSLRFLGKDIRVVDVEKITCMNVYNGFVTVGNCKGDVYCFDRKKSYRKINVYSLPITGCAFHHGWVYFSSFDGYYGRKWIGIPKWYYFILLSIMAIFIAILFKYAKFK